jgi:hypothetical protein
MTQEKNIHMRQEKNIHMRQKKSTYMTGKEHKNNRKRAQNTQDSTYT